MIRALTLLLLIAAAPSHAIAQTPAPAPAAEIAAGGADPTEAARLADAARTAYFAGHYEEAARLYDALARLAPHDSRVLYNLGTAWAQAGNNGLAIWRWLQALRHDPRNALLRRNLAAVDPEFYKRIAITPLPPLDWLFFYFTGNEWAGAAGAATLLALLAAAIALLRPRGARARPLLVRIAWTAAVLAFLCWPFAFGHYYLDHMLRRAVVVAPEATVRNEANERGLETYTLKAGSVVEIRDAARPGWYLIAFSGGDKFGFVPREQVRPL